MAPVYQPQKIIRSARRRTLALEIDSQGELIIRAPFSLSLKKIEAFIAAKQDWIAGHVEHCLRTRRVRPKFKEGEWFNYLGCQYRLKLVAEAGLPLRLEKFFFLDERYLKKAPLIFTNWYQKQARRVLKNRVDYYARKTGWTPKSFKIANTHKQWGSCTTRGILSFSWRLVLAPLEVIDYVVVHELAHLKHRHHQAAFWHAVEQHLPDYQTSRQWLRDYGGGLTWE